MPDTLRRTLRQWDLIQIVIGSVIGSGIFLVPGVVLRQTGMDVGPALLVWIVAGVLSLLGAFTYGELCAMRPEAGGLYVFIREAFGPLPAFLFGWTLFLVIASGAVATLAVAFSTYLGEILPLSPLAARLVSVGMIAVVAAVNVRGTRHGASVQNWSTAFKAGGILVMAAALLWAGREWPATLARLWPDSVSPTLLSGAGLAMIGVLWAYEGWQFVTYSAGEAVEPQRTFARGIVIGTLAIVAIYTLANLAYLAALGPEAAARSDRIAAEAMGALFGGAAGKLVAAAILVSVFSAANGVVLTAPRVFYAMARDGIFFRKLAEVHPRFGTPAFAILAGALWAMVLAATGTFEQLLTYVVFAGWIFYALGALSVFHYRRHHPEAARPFRTPGYPVTPILFVAAAAAIVVNTLFGQPARAFLGLGIVLLGTPAYAVWRRRRRAAAREPA